MRRVLHAGRQGAAFAVIRIEVTLNIPLCVQVPWLPLGLKKCLLLVQAPVTLDLRHLVS